MCQNCNCNRPGIGVEGAQDQGRDKFELLGYLHTAGLDAVGKTDGFPRLTPEEHYKVVADSVRFELTNAGYFGVQLPTFAQEFPIVDELLKTKPEEYVAKLEKEGIVSLQGTRILKRVVEILAADLKPRFMAHKIAELRDFVRAGLALQPAEREAILAGLTVGYSSTFYWQQALRDRNHPYYRILRGTDATVGKLSNADTLGGVVNCILCSEAGPVGCIGCAAVTSVWASSGAAAAFSQK